MTNTLLLWGAGTTIGMFSSMAQNFFYYKDIIFFILCIIFLISVVIWDIAGKEAICGSQAAMQSAGPVYALAFCKCSDDLLVTGGE